MGVEAAARVVLVVEDEAIVRAAIAEELRNCGWHVLEAASGEHAPAATPVQDRLSPPSPRRWPAEFRRGE